MTSDQNSPPSLSKRHSIAAALPGILLAAAVAAAAFGLSGFSANIPLNPIMLAIVLGAVIAAISGTPERIATGLEVLPRLALRSAIVLLGFQISFTELSSIGLSGLAAVLIGTFTTMLVTILAGRAMGLDRAASLLIAIGTSICGIAAIAAMGAAIRANSRDTSYAIICITLFGLLAMALLPFAATLLGLSDRQFGIWAGASIHEVAQVVAAGFQYSNAAGETATVTKLSRVVLLVPVIAAVLYYLKREAPQNAPAIVPWFVTGFLFAAGANSLISVSPDLRRIMALITAALFAFALAAIGLSLEPRKLFSGRGKEMALGLLSALWIAVITLALVWIAG